MEHGQGGGLSAALAAEFVVLEVHHVGKSHLALVAGKAWGGGIVVEGRAFSGGAGVTLASLGQVK